ncbi:MAG: FAD-binding protein [Candidatus Sulfotelmatobacter sp.]|nr:FAD-binding protein [Candidatus Sulfotelmatobacter sp.]
MFLGRKAIDYSSPPDREKNCDFVFPSDPTRSTLAALIVTPPSKPLPFEARAGFINDASCLNKTPVFGVVRVQTIEDVSRALSFARANHLKVSVAGQRHSMGGQTFTAGGLVLDMRSLNQIALDRERKIMHAQSGATWNQIQRLADDNGLSVQAMQSINVFTLGGSLSVNAHGIAHLPGPLASTVVSLRIMLSNGEIKTASRTDNPELFRLAIGGYGLFGVILNADLELVKNEAYILDTVYMSDRDFPEYYQQNVAHNPEVGLVYGRLSVSPTKYLSEAAIHVYRKAPFSGPIPPLREPAHDKLDRFVINFSKTGRFGRWLRWTLEKRGEAVLHRCLSRNEAINQKEPCLVSRNQEMYDSMNYLRNRLHDTNILQEYFIPQGKMSEFVSGLKAIVEANGANLLNVTIRVVHTDTVSALPYAKQDMFAYVLYFNQELNDRQSKILQRTTSALVDLAVGLRGTFYLPYQLYYSPAQLHCAYPEIDAFFAAKKKYDPDGLFSSKFYDKYGNA